MVKCDTITFLCSDNKWFIEMFFCQSTSIEQSGSTAICRNRTNSVECLPRDQSYQVFFVHDFSVPLPILILQTNFFLISIAIK